ncbi:hypothetical protein DFH09DRAFT_1081087 [Mycena vulgaris]|nr:hypothetical protein DFH09DRAFT_1081087 [Mycena vulgaris]
MPLVAVWFACHSITPASAVVHALEEFAHVQWNIAAGIENLSNEEWIDKLRNIVSMLGAAEPIPHSSAGFKALIHAPMEDVQQDIMQPSGIRIITELAGTPLEATTLSNTAASPS